ncbi:MAG: amidohydrolase family protein [Acidobacteria bacterium]|nr:amidohydrolase family protein [Acidobacteriota bacterium]
MKGKIALEEHIESPDFPATGTHNFTDPSYFKDVENRLHEYKLRLDDMDATGIQTTILSLTQPGVEGITDTKKAIDIARKMNDHIADFFVKANPGRFLGFAAVPLQDPDAAAKELERAVKELGFVGALVNGYTNIGDENTARYLDETPVWDFWAHVQNLDVPIYLHPRIPLPSQQRIYEGYEGLLGSAWGFGFETSTHALRLILSGLFDRYPKLNIILGHLGEALPFTLPRVEHRLRHQTKSTHGKHERPPMDYLRENFYLTTSGTFRSQALLNTLLEVGSDRVLFSVDYPYESMLEIAPWFDTCPISENDRLKIGRTNSERLFKLKS